MKAAESLKLEIISCKLAATERCEVATDQREVTLSACLQLPACSQIKQIHYMKLRRTTTKNKNHSTTKLVTKANLKPGRQHKTNEILNSSEFSISTGSLPQEGSAYQASRSTLIPVGETARSSDNASIRSGLSFTTQKQVRPIWFCHLHNGSAPEKNTNESLSWPSTSQLLIPYISSENKEIHCPAQNHEGVQNYPWL